MRLLESIANKIRYITTRREERGQYSGGYWPSRVREETIKLCCDLKGELLEVGCGEGLFLEGLASKNQSLRILGIDNWKEMVAKAQQRITGLGISNVKVSWVEPGKLPFLDNSFDIAVCINTLFNLSSLEEVRRVIKELSRVAKTDGKIIIDIRNSLSPVVFLKYKFAKYYDSTLKVPVCAYSLSRIKNILKDSGLTIEKKISIGAIPGFVAPILLIQAKKCKD